ncbi:MAG: ABC transporter substrate-binding protein [Chloroflexi bacterium]|nr:ABC transporter substrate-binding protein [Chloroflexota bacterium]
MRLSKMFPLFAITVLLAMMTVACGPAAEPTPTKAPAVAAPTATPTKAPAPTVAAPAPTLAPAAAPTPTPTRIVAAPTPTVAPVTPGVTIKRMPADTATPRKGGTLLLKEISIGKSHFDVLQEDGDGPTLTQTHNIYNLVVRLDPYDPNTVHPELAESWQWSGDGRALTFNLRKGVKWHDGKPFVAADVAYTFERMNKPKPGIISRRTGEFSRVESIEVPNDSTVVVRFKQAQPDFLVNLGGYAMQVVPKHLASPLDDKGEGMKFTIVGTGPFKAGAIEPDVSWEWRRNPEYFKPGLPYLDALRYTYMPQEETAMAAYRTGKLHMPGSVNEKANQELLLKDPNTNFVQFPANRLFAFVPSVDRPPFNDIRIREAASLTIIQQDWVKSAEAVLPFILLGAGMMPGTPSAIPTERLKKVSGYDFGAQASADRAKAADLVKQAGFAGKVKFDMLAPNLDYFQKGAIITAEQLNKGPFEAIIKTVEYANYVTGVDQAQNVAVTHSMGLKFMSTDGALEECCSAKGRRNFGRYGKPEFNTVTAVDNELAALLDKQSAEVDPAKRLQLVHDYQDLWLKQFYHIHLAWATSDVFWSKKVHNHWPHISGYQTGYMENRWLEQ